jgi:hypothetical protein
MIANPFIQLFEAPAETLLAAGYAVILFGLLVATWWGLSRNAMYLVEYWQDGWKYLVPGKYALRAVLVAVIVAVDLWLTAGIIYVLTP